MVKRQRPRDDSELAERINAYVRDPVADKYERQHTEHGIRAIERRRTRFWDDMRRRRMSE